LGHGAKSFEPLIEIRCGLDVGFAPLAKRGHPLVHPFTKIICSLGIRKD
jgi:hypothetical protein